MKEASEKSPTKNKTEIFYPICQGERRRKKYKEEVGVDRNRVTVRDRN